MLLLTFDTAGSLTNLAKAPASTVQILGAEKALFRALKTKGNTPKYGLIFHSSFIGRAKARNKGRISRYLANKCSIATRIDAFMDSATSVFGEKMKDQVGRLHRIGTCSQHCNGLYMSFSKLPLRRLKSGCASMMTVLRRARMRQ